MSNVPYYNQSGSFWDFIAGLENTDFANHPWHQQWANWTGNPPAYEASTADGPRADKKKKDKHAKRDAKATADDINNNNEKTAEKAAENTNNDNDNDNDHSDSDSTMNLDEAAHPTAGPSNAWGPFADPRFPFGRRGRGGPGGRGRGGPFGGRGGHGGPRGFGFGFWDGPGANPHGPGPRHHGRHGPRHGGPRGPPPPPGMDHDMPLRPMMGEDPVDPPTEPSPPEGEEPRDPPTPDESSSSSSSSSSDDEDHHHHHHGGRGGPHRRRRRSHSRGSHASRRSHSRGSEARRRSHSRERGIHAHGHGHGGRGGRGGRGAGRHERRDAERREQRDGERRHGGRHGGRHNPWGHNAWGGPFNVSHLAEMFQSQLFGNGPTDNNTNTKSTNNHGDFRPAADIFDTPTSYIIDLSLPGAKKSDVAVQWDAERGEVCVSGVVHRNGDEALLKMLDHEERRVGAFERRVRLGSRAKPACVDANGISAKLEDGVLRVVVPKEERDFEVVHRVEVD